MEAEDAMRDRDRKLKRKSMRAREADAPAGASTYTHGGVVPVEPRAVGHLHDHGSPHMVTILTARSP